MKRITLVVALVCAFVVPTFAQSIPEHLSKQQLNSLIASAATPAEHQRIANYFNAESERLTAEANDHAQMVATFRANPITSSDKMTRSTVRHCEYLVKSLNARSAKAREFAEEHERMANGQLKLTR